MILKDCLLIAFSLMALIVSFYSAFIGPRFQLNLHILKIISERSKEINSILTFDNLLNLKNIKEGITIIVRSIQLLDSLNDEYPIRLFCTKKLFISILYLEINDYIHNLLLNEQIEPKQLVKILSENETELGNQIISDQILFIRSCFTLTHRKYSRKN